MQEKTIIIIGAGLAGLSAGCYGRMNGFGTKIFEHASVPGGVCTAWKRNGYMFDGCIHWLFGYRENSTITRVYRELGIIPNIKFGPVETYMNVVDEKTGLELKITADYEATRNAFIAAAPEDRREIERFLENSLAFADTRILIDDPGTLGTLRLIGLLWQWRKAFFCKKKYGLPAEEYARNFRNPWMKKVMAGIFHPRMPAVFNMMVLGWLFGRDMCTIEGGSLNFAQTIEKRYLELGGEIAYKSTVKKILVDNGRAVGVELEDGSVHRGDIVISAADLHSTLFDMLGGKYLTPRLQSMFEHEEIFEPILYLSYGIKDETGSHPSTNLIFLEEPLQIGETVCAHLFVRDTAYDPAAAPAGGRVVQVTLSTDYDTWDRLRQSDIDAYRAEKKRISESVLSKLDRYYPGIAGRLEARDVATPATFYRYTRNWRGAYEGWIMTMDNFKHQIKKTMPCLDNFYLCGQWVEPGGGVPMVMVSGRRAVQLLCKRERMAFKTNS